VSRRRKPSKRWRDQALDFCDNRCFWCLLPFGSWAVRGEQMTLLEVQWDHVDPFMYTGLSSDCEFICACQLCNSMKRAHVFHDIADARTFITERLKQKGWAFVPLHNKSAPRRLLNVG
jgi:hypothetical protein